MGGGYGANHLAGGVVNSPGGILYTYHTFIDITKGTYLTLERAKEVKYRTLDNSEEGTDTVNWSDVEQVPLSTAWHL